MLNTREIKLKKKSSYFDLFPQRLVSFSKILLFFFLCSFSKTSAQTLYEGFSYLAGENIGGNTSGTGGPVNNWFTHSNSLVGTIDITTGSLNYAGLQGSGGNKIRLPGSNSTVSRDVNRALTGFTDSVAYYSFLLSVIDATQLSGTTSDYFIHFSATSGTSASTFGARVGIRSVNSASGYRLSIANNTTTVTENINDLSFGTTYFVVVKFNKAAAPTVASLWINPASLGGAEPLGQVINSSGVSTFGTFGAICLRNASNTPKADIDEIRVGTTWASVTPAAPITNNCPFSVAVAPNTDVVTCIGNKISNRSAQVTLSGGTGTPTQQYQWYYNSTNSSLISTATLVTGATAQAYNPPTTLADAGTRYYFCVAYATDNGCAQTNSTQSLASNAIKVTVNNTSTPAPSGNASQNFCSGDNPTVANLAATGTSLKWYLSNGLQALPASSLVSGLQYRGTQTINGCESLDSLLVTVAINTSPSSITATSPQFFCNGSTPLVSALTATAVNPLVWYAKNTDLTPLASSAPLSDDSTYYGAQLDPNGCRSANFTPVRVVNLSSLNYGTVSRFEGLRYPVISQVYGSGGNTGATYLNDYVELFNPTADTINLSGWTLQYQASASTTWSNFASLTGLMPPGKYYLIRLGSGGVAGKPVIPAEVFNNNFLASNSGKLSLVNSTSILTSCTEASIVDKMSVGTNSVVCNEGGANAPAPSTNVQALIRGAAGCTDNNNNGTDFALGLPYPRNALWPSNICSGPSGEFICFSGIPDTMMVAGAAGATDFSYQWYYQDGVVAAPSGSSTLGWTSLGTSQGANTAFYKPNSAINATRTYACFVSPSGSPLCGSGGQWASGVNVVTIGGIPSTPVFTTGTSSTNNPSTCSGLTGKIYAVSSVSGATQYTWTVPSGWVITAGQNTASITVTIGTTGGDVTVTAGNNCGTSATATLSVTVSSLPAAPVATNATAVLSSGFTATWQPVAGATDYFLDVSYFKSGDTLAGWSFPLISSPLTPSTSNSNNLSSTLSTIGGTGSISVVSSSASFAATANGWNGGNGSKAWQININTIGYTSVKLFSRQRSSNTGPRDFKVQYKIGNAGIWTDVPSGTVQVDALYNLGVVNNISLPAACDNQPLVFIRWIMTSDLAVDGALVASGGTNRIDDIALVGSKKDYVAGYLNFNTSNTSEEVTGLQPNTTYFYVVRANVFCGATSNSNEIQVTTLPPCVSAATIASFTPSSGPVGTRVTIRGSGFNTVNSVRFGITDAPVFSVINDSVITVTVPDGVTKERIRFPIGICPAESNVDFIPITSSGCGNSGNAASDLFISEVFDASRGSLSYIELFNGTANPISLNGVYSIRVVFNGNSTSTTDVNLTGTINSGGTYLVKIKDAIDTSTVSCPIDNSVSITSTTGSFNGNDQVYLRKNAVNLDYIPNPNFGGGTSAGFSQKRKPGVVLPSLNYSAADWDISQNESCDDLGLPPYDLAGTSINVTAQPVDNDNCLSLNFSVSATSSAGSLNYLWKYYDPASDQWVNASGLTSASAGITASNTNTASMSVSGNIGDLFGYQFYCELTKLGCTANTRAVQYAYSTKRYYRSKGSGPWSNASNWEMSDLLNDWSGAIAACAPPTQSNCSGVILQSPFVVTQDVDIALDYLEIKSGATLTTTQNASLTILDSSAGADFLVNGTWNYDANAANSALGGASGATWQLGASGTIVKTSDGSAANLRDKYHAGMSAIPSTANWILRYNGSTANVSFTTTGGSVYPNLIFENFLGGTWKPQARFSGISDYAIIKGNLDVGGSGAAIDSLINENKNANPLLVQGNLIIRNGCRLMTAVAATGFEIKGNLINEGIFSVNSNDSGLIKFTGSSAQQISGGGGFDFIDMLVANSGGALSIESDIEIPGTLNISNGASLRFGAGNIKIKSSSEKTARIGLLQNVTIQYDGPGKFIIQRYISSGRKWRHLSVPVNSDTLSIKSSWQSSMVITDNTSGWSSKGFDAFSPGGASMKVFDANTQAYKPVNRTDSLLRNPFGYMVFVRGDRTCLPGNLTIAPTTLSSSGPIYVGNQVMTVSAGGFNSIGNPYASSVDIRKLLKTNFDTSFIYVWDPKLSGSYGLGGMQTLKFKNGNYYAVPGGGSYADSNSINNLIQSGQAFFIHNSGSSAGSVTFTEASKEAGSRLVFRNAQSNDFLTGKLFRQSNGGIDSELLDGYEMEFSADAENAINADDAIKFPNGGENLGIRKFEKLLVIERRAPLKNRDSVIMETTGLKAGKYLLELNAEINENQLQGFLVDRHLQKLISLNLSGVTQYDFEIKDASSARKDRFYLLFKKGQSSNTMAVRRPIENEVIQNKLLVYPNPVTGRQFKIDPGTPRGGQEQVSIFDVEGNKIQLNYQHFDGRKMSLPESMKSGLYQIHWTDGQLRLSGKFILIN
jgi:hypothetical protein